MRLDKYLSEAGLTRTQAKAAVSRGRVTVNGQPVQDAALKIEENALVLLDGQEVGRPGHIHLMMNKPAGVVTALEDARFATVFDLIPPRYRRKDLCAVGRLDRDTTGLLLFTTDGQLAHRLISPRFTVEKAYLATVDGALTEEHVRRMAEGIRLTDFTARGAPLEILSSNLGRLTVTEGKYHQVRRMFGALGCPVTALHRESVGGITLDPTLQPGEIRPLTSDEIARLLAITRWEEP